MSHLSFNVRIPLAIKREFSSLSLSFFSLICSNRNFMRRTGSEGRKSKYQWWKLWMKWMGRHKNQPDRIDLSHFLFMKYLYTHIHTYPPFYCVFHWQLFNKSSKTTSSSRPPSTICVRVALYSITIIFDHLSSNCFSPMRLGHAPSTYGFKVFFLLFVALFLLSFHSLHLF